MRWAELSPFVRAGYCLFCLFSFNMSWDEIGDELSWVSCFVRAVYYLFVCFHSISVELMSRVPLLEHVIVFLFVFIRYGLSWDEIGDELSWVVSFCLFYSIWAEIRWEEMRGGEMRWEEMRGVALLECFFCLFYSILAELSWVALLERAIVVFVCFHSIWVGMRWAEMRWGEMIVALSVPHQINVLSWAASSGESKNQ